MNNCMYVFKSAWKPRVWSKMKLEREGKEEEVKIEFISLVLFECFPTISMHASHKCKKE